MNYKRIKYQTRRVGAHDKRELIRATGQDYVPAIVDGRKVVTYREIPDFLETMKPEPSIYPNKTKGTAKAIESWAHYRLEEVVWQYSVPDMPDRFKDEIERWVFVEMQEIKRGPLERLKANRAQSKVEMERHFLIIEDMLHEHNFLLSDRPSLADFAVFGALSPLAYSGNSIPAKFKRLTSWHEVIKRI